MRPRVVVTTANLDPEKAKKLSFYLTALEEAGAEPVILSPALFEAEKRSLGPVHALLLSGGGDVHPSYYGQPPRGTDMESVDLPRDEMELYLVRWALARDVPILAICRGFQVLNVALGGTLTQHVEGHRQPRDRVEGGHEVHVLPGSRLWEALGRRNRLYVNTHHHQMVMAHDLSPRLQASAWLADNPAGIEGIESPDHRWVIGVQWHPERFHEFPPDARAAQRSLFRHFVRAALGEVIPA